MNLGKAYYRVDRKATWPVLQMLAGEDVHERAAEKFLREEQGKSMLRVERREGVSMRQFG